MKVESLKRLKSEKLRVVNSSYRAPSAHLCGPLTTHDSPFTKKAFTLAEGASHTLPSKMIKYHFVRGKTCNNNRKAAFTLAEVLITLGIIGVVAAITMPTLIQKHRRHVVETQLKKAYSEISQALQLAEVEHGLMNEWNFSDATLFEYEEQENINTSNTADFMNNYLAKFMKTVKVCNEKEDTSCWTTPLTPNGKSSRFVHGASNGALSFITQSGYSVLVWLAGAGRDGGICIDIDGPNKGSGVVGKDVFVMYVFFRDFYQQTEDEIIDYKKGVYLYGGYDKRLTEDDILNGQEEGCSKNITSSWAGSYCGLMIQRNGWKVPDNYPVKF